MDGNIWKEYIMMDMEKKTWLPVWCVIDTPAYIRVTGSSAYVHFNIIISIINVFFFVLIYTDICYISILFVINIL